MDKEAEADGPESLFDQMMKKIARLPRGKVMVDGRCPLLHLFPHWPYRFFISGLAAQ